ncbi:MAG: hypothetical protein SGCHY_000096 [Lobulomycetales sp.]
MGISLVEPDPSHDWSEDPELISQVKRQIEEREQLKQAKKLEKERRRAAKELERSSRQLSAMKPLRNMGSGRLTRKCSQGSLSPSFRSNSVAGSVSTVETDKDSAVEMKGLVDSYFRLSVVDFDSGKALSATSIPQFPHSIESFESRESEASGDENEAALRPRLSSGSFRTVNRMKREASGDDNEATHRPRLSSGSFRAIMKSGASGY